MENKLSELKNLKANLKGNKFYTKKNLGQNFLVDDIISKEIIVGASLNKDDTVVEIGPGVGSLTRYIAREVKEIKAVEIDTKAIDLLEKNLSEFNNVEIINKDILKLDLNEIVGSKRIKVVANLPYYITSPIIMYLLESKLNIESITIMVQKEVGERIMANAGTKSYGVLTLAVNYYSEVEKIVDVDKKSFYPVPKVDSVVVKLIPKNKDSLLNEQEEKEFFKLVKGGFRLRRKTLVNSLASIFNGNKEEVRSFLEKCDIDGKRRGETLSLNEYIKLSKIRSNKKWIQ